MSRPAPEFTELRRHGTQITDNLPEPATLGTIRRRARSTNSPGESWPKWKIFLVIGFVALLLGGATATLVVLRQQGKLFRVAAPQSAPCCSSVTM